MTFSYISFFSSICVLHFSFLLPFSLYTMHYIVCYITIASPTMQLAKRQSKYYTKWAGKWLLNNIHKMKDGKYLYRICTRQGKRRYMWCEGKNDFLLAGWLVIYEYSSIGCVDRFVWCINVQRVYDWSVEKWESKM